ncbi:hypothetical protein PVAR5_6710 [Paecilomyces variotii No. 5]|uniref:Aspergillopepsin n=1 Tax=Byssochlamys spectabilis (strain No. 5 / NBRC 109023) TaxID=1356009 RepID=V5GAS9_BYSSN|nr:hypothetical protein PVAR5_6710 [Paecilomyces variotii No. 5]
MKFATTVLLTSAIWTTSALAAPRAGFGVPPKAPGDKNGALAAEQSTSADIEYGYNWAGVIHTTPPATGTYTAASATFTVPEPTATDDSSGGKQGASAWVGIDGGTYRNAILQAGVDFYVEGGTKNYDAWYEWYPAYSNDFNLSISAGDIVIVKVVSSSPSQGVAILENESSGQSATQTLSADPSTATLGGQNVEWMVEDYQSGSSDVALVNFNKVKFTGVQAETSDGQKIGTDGATIYDIQQNGDVLTNVTIISDTEFDVSYEAAQ